MRILMSMSNHTSEQLDDEYRDVTLLDNQPNGE